MTAKAKPQNLNVALRRTYQEQILRALFTKPLEELVKSANALAQSIVDRAHADYFKALKDEKLKPYLAANIVGGTFRYTDKEGNTAHFGVPNLVFSEARHEEPVSLTYDLDEISRPWRHHSSKAGVRAIANGPGCDGSYSLKTVGTLRANDARALQAIERKSMKLVEHFKEVRTGVTAALGACKTVEQFKELYPDLAALCKIEERAAQVYALAPRNEDILKSIKSAGIALPAIADAAAA